MTLGQLRTHLRAAMNRGDHHGVSLCNRTLRLGVGHEQARDLHELIAAREDLRQRDVRTKVVALALESAQAHYDHEVAQVAELARDQLVPYFQKRGWSYVASNDTWWITDRRNRFVDESRLPTSIREVLYLKVARAQYLGYFIRDIELETCA
jgi:hypothetical protein